MNCEVCDRPDADCLTVDGNRVCEACLHARVEVERDRWRVRAQTAEAECNELRVRLAEVTRERDGARAMQEVAEKFHDVAVAERNLDRARHVDASFERDRNVVRRAALEQMVSELRHCLAAADRLLDTTYDIVTGDFPASDARRPSARWTNDE